MANETTSSLTNPVRSTTKQVLRHQANADKAMGELEELFGQRISKAAHPNRWGRVSWQNKTGKLPTIAELHASGDPSMLEKAAEEAMRLATSSEVTGMTPAHAQQLESYAEHLDKLSSARGAQTKVLNALGAIHPEHVLLNADARAANLHPELHAELEKEAANTAKQRAGAQGANAAEQGAKWWHKFILNEEGMQAAKAGFAKEGDQAFKLTKHVHGGKAALLAAIPAGVGYLWHQSHKSNVQNQNPHMSAIAAERKLMETAPEVEGQSI